MAENTKYNTDPLDPTFEQQTSELWGATRPISHDAARETIEQARRSETAEDATRRLDENETAYRSVFATQHETNGAPQNGANNYATQFSSPAHTTPFDPSLYAPPTASAYVPPTINGAQFNSPARKVAKLGLPENLAAMLPYTPFYIGIVVALLELILVPRQEVRTRFHAAQGLGLHLAILAVSFLFRIVALTTGYHVGGILFSIAAFVFLIISMIRVYQGKPHAIAPLADLTKWINEKIEPRGKARMN